MTTIASDALLLSINPETGQRHAKDETGCAVTGALLAELALDGYVAFSDKKVEPTEQGKEARGLHPQLQDLLDRIVEDKPRSAQKIVEKAGTSYVQPLLDELVGQGVVAATKGRLLGILPETRYPLTDSSPAGPRGSIVASLRAVIESGTGEDARQLVLAQLIEPLGLRKEIAPGLSKRELSQRLEQIAPPSTATEAVRRAIESAKAAGAAAAGAAAAAAAVAASS